MLDTDTHLDEWMRGWATTAPTTYQGSDALAFQRWFKFKEAFSPALVKGVIDSLPTKVHSLLDCCAGSGTSGVVAQFLGINSTLIEVNPFLADVIKAKLTDYSEVDLSFEAARILERAASIKAPIEFIRERLPPTFIEPGVNGRWIFNSNVAKSIEQIRLAIAACRKAPVRRLFNVALGSTLIALSNVRVDGKGRRYRQNWQARQPTIAEVRVHFVDALSRMIEDIYRFGMVPRAPVDVVLGDARFELSRLEDSFDLAIFSPPYPNSFDYTDIYNVELWTLGYLKSFKDNSSLRLNTLRSHVQIGWERPTADVGSKTLRITLKELALRREDLWDSRLPYMIHAYFEDMKILITKICVRLKSGGTIAIVVGDSAYAGIRIDSAQIISEIAIALGLRTASKKSVRVMRSSMQQSNGNKILDEWLLLLTH